MRPLGVSKISKTPWSLPSFPFLGFSAKHIATFSISVSCLSAGWPSSPRIQRFSNFSCTIGSSNVLSHNSYVYFRPFLVEFLKSAIMPTSLPRIPRFCFSSSVRRWYCISLFVLKLSNIFTPLHILEFSSMAYNLLYNKLFQFLNC